MWVSWFLKAWLVVVCHLWSAILYREYSWTKFILEICCWSSSISKARQNKLPKLWALKSNARSRRASINAGSPPIFRSPVFASKLLMWLRNIIWDLMRLEIEQESLSSACKSKGPSGSAHFSSAVRRCWPRVILFLDTMLQHVGEQGEMTACNKNTVKKISWWNTFSFTFWRWKWNYLSLTAFFYPNIKNQEELPEQSWD